MLCFQNLLSQLILIEGLIEVFVRFCKGDLGKILFIECRLMLLFEFIVYLGYLDDDVMGFMFVIFQEIFVQRFIRGTMLIERVKERDLFFFCIKLNYIIKGFLKCFFILKRENKFSIWEFDEIWVFVLVYYA